MEKYFDINANGFSIRCKLYCADPRKIEKIIIFGHGFGGHKDNRAAARFAAKAVAKNVRAGVLVFDWPAHGSDGRSKVVLEDCGSYLDTVLEYVKGPMGIEDIYAHGTSFGAYCMLKYISEKGNPFIKAAFRCPAVNMYETFSAHILNDDNLRDLGKGRDTLAGFDRKVKITRQFVEDLRTNDITTIDFTPYADDLMILHGTKDEIIPIDIVKAFCENSVIEFVPCQNADHRFKDLSQLDQANSIILNFFGI